ncbi:Hypothetical protein glysoja_010685 [Glycine soja]|nr:Hypothetical protein glysoja_010685 [Glycine soja]
MAIRGIGMSFSAPSTTRPILSLNPRFLSASSTIPLFLVPSRSSYLLLSFSFSRPETECPVPHEQQPINEYQSLSTSFPFSWAAGDVVEYASRLFVTGASFALLLGLPMNNLMAWMMCAMSFGLVKLPRQIWSIKSFVVFFVVPLLYTLQKCLCMSSLCFVFGWYEQIIWVKTAEVLARDRLLGSFFVKPVLGRLKITLVSLATSLLVCALILINIDGDQNLTSKEPRVRVVPGVYNDDSARLFEPDAFRDELDLQ